MRTLILALCLVLIGCAGQPKYTQAQLNALETREIDADTDAAFTAASHALFDSGYTITMSDRMGGLLTGSKRHDNKRDRLFVKRSERWTEFSLSVQVRGVNPALSAVRVKTATNGEPRVDTRAIDEFWILMQRQVLINQPVQTPRLGP